MAEYVDTRAAVDPPKPEELSTLSKIIRNNIGELFKTAAKLIGAVTAPVPDDTGDGSKLAPEEKNGLLQKVEGDLRDLTHLGVSDFKSLLGIAKEKFEGGTMDDREYMMEALIRVAAKLPDGSANRTALTDQFLTQLWTDLPHPPQSYLGSKYQYRSADGSFNSLKHPQLGAAGTPYARTVKPSMMQTPAQPDAGVVFDSVMARKPENTEKHPNSISSMLFYLASIIIHDCFRTDHSDQSNSLTSSYLDLSPLYGSNQAEQDLMRTRVDGKLKLDCFSESRLLFFPPGVGALLIMFNRFHNFVVGNLADINEGNRFPKPAAPADAADEDAARSYDIKLRKYDEDLFQTGRLITCGLYVNIILVDYVRTILDLNRTDSNWQLNPRAEIKGVEMGVGNQVSAEFNLIYRWHSTLSTRDEKWTEDLWADLFPGEDGERRDPKSIDNNEFLGKMREVYHKSEKDPQKRKFAGLERNANGTLPDQALVDILTASVEDCANSFGPNRVPTVMRAIEVLGIEQARAWNLGTLNEFRKYFGLEPHRTFDDISSDKYVAEQLKHLYDHPDKVEIYPGIVVEDAKKPMAPGSGLCPPYTVSRAVLSDAVALVRGDRFYTIDYNPKTLTNWGYKIVDSDNGIDNGCVFYKLFQRAFPQHFVHNSVYAHYPMTTPDAMEVALKDLKKDHLYNFDKPSYTPPPHMITSYKAATEIMANQKDWKVTWGAALTYLMGPAAKDFMLAGDGPKNKSSRDMMTNALYMSDWDKQVRSYYTLKTRELLKEKSARIADFTQVDIIRDVGNLAHVHFCAEMFMLPLKTAASPHGIFSESELYTIMSSVFALVFFDADPASSFPLHIKSHAAVQQLGALVLANVAAIADSGALSHITALIWPKDSALKGYGIHMIQRLLASGMPPDQLVWGHILGTAGGMVANQGQLFAQMLEFFLVGDGKAHWPAIAALAARPDDDEDAFETLSRYVLEGSRLNGETGVYREAAAAVSVTDGATTTHFAPGDRVFLNLRTASHDETAFRDPDAVDLTRDVGAYVHLGHGAHRCIGADMTRVALTAMLREVARLEGVRPARGLQGRVNKVVRRGLGEVWPYHGYLGEGWEGVGAFPGGWKVVW